jgi:hypothetical protein
MYNFLNAFFTIFVYIFGVFLHEKNDFYKLEVTLVFFMGLADFNPGTNYSGIWFSSTGLKLLVFFQMVLKGDILSLAKLLLFLAKP